MFPRLPNPTLVMYIFPHLAGDAGAPVPGYTTAFPMYEQVEYALPVKSVVSRVVSAGEFHEVSPYALKAKKDDKGCQTEDLPVTTNQVKQLYERPPSFTDFLPWMEYNPASRTFLLEDGISVGALFELIPAGTEARTPAFMTQLRDAIQTALTDAIPEEDDAPWILQVYVQDDPSLQDSKGDRGLCPAWCA